MSRTHLNISHVPATDMVSEAVEDSNVSTVLQGYHGMQTMDEWLEKEAQNEVIDAQNGVAQPQPGSKKAAKAARAVQLQAVEEARKAAKAARASQLQEAEEARKAGQRLKSERIQALAAEDEFASGLDLTENYIGRLLEYRATCPIQSGPNFTETDESTPIGPRFTCTLSIGESSEIFGALPRRILFRQKKMAKQFACKAAITFLISQGLIPECCDITLAQAQDAHSVPEKSSSQSSNSVPPTQMDRLVSKSVNNSDPSPSFASRVPELCRSLGLVTPTYMLLQIPDFPAMYDGYAHFPEESRISGKIGEFRRIHGRKNAKETCAAEVFSFLESMRDQSAALDEKAKEHAMAALRREK